MPGFARKTIDNLILTPAGDFKHISTSVFPKHTENSLILTSISHYIDGKGNT